jgi:hypothetical protein
MTGHAPYIGLMKELGRCLRLDEKRKESEEDLEAGKGEPLTSSSRDRDLDARYRDEKAERALPHAPRESWLGNRMIFVLDSKTAEGRRFVPISRRVF